MARSTGSPSRLENARRAAVLLAAVFVGAVAAACGDHLTGPGSRLIPGNASLAVSPVFPSVPSGAPSVQLSKITGALVAATGDSILVTSNFDGDSAVVEFNVQITGTSEEFTLDLTAFDMAGIVAYRSTQIVIIRPGFNPRLSAPLFVYAAPDAGIRTLHVSAPDTLIVERASSTFTVVGADAAGQPVALLRVGWTSHDPQVAAVDGAGNVRAGTIPGSTWVVARAGNDVADSVLVHVVSPIDHIEIAPTALTFASITQTQTIAVHLVPRAGASVDGFVATVTSANPFVATADSAGNVTAVSNGTTTVTASADGVTATIPVTVAQVAASITVSPRTASVATGGTAAFKATAYDALANAIPTAVVTWSSSDPTIASVTPDGQVTGGVAGTATITATVGSIAGSATLTVTSVGTPLSLNVSSVEKIPGGTQQFVVTGGTGPYQWQVNGVVNGNSTYGTISADGNTATYNAPQSVPSPSSFSVCVTQLNSQLAPACATVTIDPIPTSGEDVVVMNDANIFDDTGGSDPNNQLLFRNLVNYTGSATRASNADVMFYFGHSSAYGPGDIMRTTIANAGYTITDVSTDFTAPIPDQYKVVMLWLPTVAFSDSEINILKQFASQGGRIVFIGEFDSFYGSGIDVENAFLQSMGAQMTNAGGAYDCSGQDGFSDYVTLPASRIEPHQVTTGMTGLTVACVSEVIPGPNDYVLFRSFDGQHVLGGVAKIDVTPLPLSPSRRTANPPRITPLRTKSRSSGVPAWHDPARLPPGAPPE